MDDFTEFLYNFYWIIYLLIIGIADVLLQELRGMIVNIVLKSSEKKYHYRITGFLFFLFLFLRGMIIIYAFYLLNEYSQIDFGVIHLFLSLFTILLYNAAFKMRGKENEKGYNKAYLILSGIEFFGAVVSWCILI